MKILFVCATAAALTLAACTSSSQTSSSESSAAPEASSMAMATTTPMGSSSMSKMHQMSKMGGNMVTVTMNAQNGSGESGTATLKAMGKQTSVTISLKGEPAGGDQPAHIHPGSCANLDPKPKYPLSNVKGGKSTTTVDATLASLTKGNMAINVHESAKNIQKYVSCGDIKG